MKRQQNYLYHVDMMIVESCTFRCKNCNMFIPYYKEVKKYNLESLKRNVDLLFERIEYVVWFGLIGGETLLCKDLPEILEYIYEKYRDRIGQITMTTNGSIVPSGRLIAMLKKCNVLLEVSDYRETVSYEEQFENIIKVLDSNNVNYKVLKTLVWTDFGFPMNPVNRDEEQLKYHLECCHPEWNGLSDGKFYYCNVSCSAEKSGFFELNKNDYIILEDIDKNDRDDCNRIVKLSRGPSSFCSVCGGCGIDNINYVAAGEQLK